MENALRGEVIGRTLLKNEITNIQYIIDTCYTHDTHLYETAIFNPDNKVKIAAHYKNSEAALSGHKYYVRLYAEKLYN